MPVFKTRTALQVARNVRAFLNLEGGVVRGPAPEESVESEKARSGQQGQPQGPRAKQQPEQVKRLRRDLKSKDEEIDRLKAALAEKDGAADSGGVSPERMIWIFGNGRTGSTWLSHMMKDMKNHRIWPEPDVGELFGSAYYNRAREGQLASGNFVLGNKQRETWLKAIRAFVRQSVDGRFPELTESGYLVVKEPHGSVGAPLIMEALPESRMVLLVRDPRDVVSSSLDSLRKESWGSKKGSGRGAQQVLQDPDAFVKNRSQQYLRGMGNSRQAYEAHEGPKAMARYEDLRADTLGTMRRIYSDLGIPVDDDHLTRIVEKHSWEAIPDEKKGEGKFYRKATPGGWGEDLTPEQARIVEETTAPLLAKFYPGEQLYESQG